MTSLAGFAQHDGARRRAGVSRPFDVDRDGFVMGEGAAVLILEEWEHAVGARRHDPRRGPRRGEQRRRPPHHRAVAGRRRARSPACASPSTTPASQPGDIRQINAHGTSTPLNDAAEAEAVREVFGEHGPPVTSIKGVTGHALGAAGALEAAAVLLSIQQAG